MPLRLYLPALAPTLLAAAGAVHAQPAPVAPAPDSARTAATWRVPLRGVRPGDLLRVTTTTPDSAGAWRLVARYAAAGDSGLVLVPRTESLATDPVTLPWREVRYMDHGVRTHAERMAILGLAGGALGLAVGRQFGEGCAPNAYFCFLPERATNALVGAAVGWGAGVLVGRYAVRPVTRWFTLHPGRRAVRRLGIFCPLALRLTRQCV